jgi:putative DNA-invertase from lambdoid prophage Rac
MSKRVAIYVRVSKSNGSQTTDNQLPDCKALAGLRGEVVQIYEEQGSAAKTRPVFDQVMADAKDGKFDVLVVWALDRFGRSMHRNLADVITLDALGIRLASVKESWLDTDSPVRSLLIAIFSWVAEQERARLIERTNAGLERAVKEGKKLGPPVTVAVDLRRVEELIAEGKGQRAIARETGLNLGTLQRNLKVSGLSVRKWGEGGVARKVKRVRRLPAKWMREEADTPMVPSQLGQYIRPPVLGASVAAPRANDALRVASGFEDVPVVLSGDVTDVEFGYEDVGVGGAPGE